MKSAKEYLENHDVVCVVANGARVLPSGHSGIRPMMDWLAHDREKLNGACVADKVVGKAVALLMVLGDVKEVYAELISQPAADCLTQHGIAFTYKMLVPYTKPNAN